MIIWAIIAAVLIAADRITKYLVASNMTLYQAVPAIPGFEIRYTQNTGAAFSMFSGMTGVLSAVSVLFCIGVIVYIIIKKPKNKLLLAALTLIFSGALGNAVDRIFLGYVVDFIQTTFINFATFNVADIEITVGAALLMVYVIFFDEKV